MRGYQAIRAGPVAITSLVTWAGGASPARRKALIVHKLHAIALVVALAVLSGCAASQTVKTHNDPDAQSVMDTVIPGVFGHWDANALAAVADPKVYTNARIEQDRKFFHELSSKLGPMTAYSKATGTTEITGTGADQTKRASYDARLTYERGSADIHVIAEKKQGKWLVEDASVQPSQHLLVH